MSLYFEVYRDEAEQWRFRLNVDDGEIVVTSEPYPTEEDVIQAGRAFSQRLDVMAANYEPRAKGAIPSRSDFVSGIVDGVLQDMDYDGHPLGPAIKDAILAHVLVSEREWQAVLRLDPSQLDEDRTAAVLAEYLKESLEFFPPDILTPADLPVIIPALRIKFAAINGGFWPCDEINWGAKSGAVAYTEAVGHGELASGT